MTDEDEREYESRNMQLEGTDHLDGSACWCGPKEYYMTDFGSVIWQHFEPGDDRSEEPPAQLMFETIAELVWADKDRAAGG